MRSIASLMRLLVASLVLVVPAIPGYAADRHAQAPAGSPPAQAVPSAQSDTIPVAEIAAQAATTTAFLRGFWGLRAQLRIARLDGGRNTWFQIRSELAVAVHDAVLAAGMSFPFPQREVRLVRNGP